jgi:hypothetical protein
MTRSADAGVRWPADYVALDAGRLRVHPGFLPTLRERGWTTVAAVLDAADVSVVRRVGGRDNCRVTLTNANGAGVETFLKRHFDKRGPAAGLHEADAVGWCQAAGAPTMEVVAAGADGPRSFFLSAKVPDAVPADDLWKSLPNSADRRALLDALAETAGAFHRAGLFHRDFYWCHFYARRLSGSRFAAHLIDLQRVLRRPRLSWRWRVKDLGQFWFSAPRDLGATDRKRWFGEYFASRPRWGLDWAAVWRAGFYRFKDGRTLP